MADDLEPGGGGRGPDVPDVADPSVIRCIGGEAVTEQFGEIVNLRCDAVEIGAR